MTSFALSPTVRVMKDLLQPPCKDAAVHLPEAPRHGGRKTARRSLSQLSAAEDRGPTPHEFASHVHGHA